MNCEIFENMMIINIYGKLTSEEKSEFNHHLSECSDCSAKYESINTQEKFLENCEAPKPDWEKSWQIIAQKSIRKKRLFDYSYHKYVLAAATVILVFVIGLSVGRKMIQTQSDNLAASASSISELSLQTFAEDLEPILIDFLNRSDQPLPKEFAKFEKEIVSDLLIKTKLLKYIMKKRDNIQLVQLLGDIEFILLNLSNLRPGDSLSTKQIQHFIREKNLKIQLKLVANEKITI